MRSTTTTALVYTSLSLLALIETTSANTGRSTIMFQADNDWASQVREFFMTSGGGFEDTRAHRRFIDSSLSLEEYDTSHNFAHRTLNEMQGDELDQHMIQAPLIAGCAILVVVGFLLSMYAHQRRSGSWPCCAAYHKNSKCVMHSSSPSTMDDGKNDQTNRTTSHSSADPVYLSETFGPDVGFRDELYMQHFQNQPTPTVVEAENSPTMMVNIV
jgi:hypothetical protein